MFQLEYYRSGGHRPFIDWLEQLRDRQARARIQARIARLALGNFGDCKAIGGGVLELRIDWGPGYRVYCARVGQVLILLLCGGDKTTQQKDIENAKTYLQDYIARTAKAGSTRKPQNRRP
jgi:putative addiction module killer protein